MTAEEQEEIRCCTCGAPIPPELRYMTWEGKHYCRQHFDDAERTPQLPRSPDRIRRNLPPKS